MKLSGFKIKMDSTKNYRSVFTFQTAGSTNIKQSEDNAEQTAAKRMNLFEVSEKLWSRPMGDLKMEQPHNFSLAEKNKHSLDLFLTVVNFCLPTLLSTWLGFRFQGLTEIIRFASEPRARRYTTEYYAIGRRNTMMEDKFCEITRFERSSYLDCERWSDGTNKTKIYIYSSYNKIEIRFYTATEWNKRLNKDRMIEVNTKQRVKGR